MSGLIGPALLVDEGLWVEPRSVGRFAGDVAIETGHDVVETDTTLANAVELGECSRLADLVRIPGPELLAVVGWPPVDDDKRARARFFLLFWLLVIGYWFFFASTFRTLVVHGVVDFTNVSSSHRLIIVVITDSYYRRLARRL